MLKLSRYNLLISLTRHELRYKHNLGKTEKDQEQNNLLLGHSLTAWIFLAEDLMCKNDISTQARDTRIANMLKVVNNRHISSTLLILKQTYDLLIDHIAAKDSIVDYADFKGRFNDWEGSLIGFLISPIKESLMAVLTSQILLDRGVYHCSSTRDMWICAHYLQFLNKLNIKGVGLEESALADCLAAEDETSQLDLASCQPYIPALQKILKDWMKEWDYDGGNPSHGPGSVADTSRSKLKKYYRLSMDDRIRYLYGCDQPDIFPAWRSQHFDRTSKLVFVPKNITKLRSISMEPATLQYLQQGCMKSLYKYFRSQPKLRSILKLTDQTQNKSFAYHGSITNDYATIDLSHASDSVNWKLVKCLFSRTPKLLKWLLCTRSTHTLLPTGEIIELTKFAPMGSALCFPIESLIFAAIAQLSIWLSREQCADRDDLTGIRSPIKFLTVYGDDIIVPTYAANICSELLQLFGFSLNKNKSYLEGPFKESCGGNYFCGYDITAIKFAPSVESPYCNGVSPAAYMAYCSYANLAYERGLSFLRLHCIHTIRDAGLQPLFTDKLDRAPAIFSEQPTNFHLKKKYSRRYQKYQYIYTGTKAVEVDEDIHEDMDEDIYFFDRMLSNDGRDESSSLFPINGKIHDGCLEFDISAPYSRKTLLEKTIKYSLCFSDI